MERNSQNLKRKLIKLINGTLVLLYTISELSALYTTMYTIF